MLWTHPRTTDSMIIRDVTIWVDAILRIAFECIAIYCHIAICG